MSLSDAANSQLVVVDVQDRLAAAMPEQVLAEMVSRCTLLVDAANILGVPVLRTEQYPRGLGATLAHIRDHLSDDSEAIEKTCFSCVGEQGFLGALATAGRRQIVLTGMEAHVCVLQTAIQLLHKGFEVFVVEDAVCSRSGRYRDNALMRLGQAGVVVSNSESVIFEWLRDARHERFRAVSALLK